MIIYKPSTDHEMLRSYLKANPEERVHINALLDHPHLKSTIGDILYSDKCEFMINIFGYGSIQVPSDSFLFKCLEFKIEWFQKIELSDHFPLNHYDLVKFVADFASDIMKPSALQMVHAEITEFFEKKGMNTGNTIRP